MARVHFVRGVARFEVALAGDGLGHVHGVGRRPARVELPQRLGRRPARGVEVVHQPDDVILHALEAPDRARRTARAADCARPTSRTPPGSRRPCTSTAPAARGRARARAPPSPGCRVRRAVRRPGLRRRRSAPRHCHERNPGRRRARTPGARASTSSRLTSAGPSPVRAATIRSRRRGGVAHEELDAVQPVAIADPLRPQRHRLRAPRGARIHDGDRQHRSPRATAGRMALRCASLPASSIVSAPSTPELKNGPGTGPRPSSS